MQSDRFFIVNIVDRLARMAMLLFEGLILGIVLSLFYFYASNSSIGWTLVFITVYILFFSVYVAWANARRRITRVELFKDKLCVVYTGKNEIPHRVSINYSDIKSYKISSGTDFKNKDLETPDLNKYSLRIYGFDTTIETKDGSKIHFADSQGDKVLIYSPYYIYRMLDLKRAIPDFPLELKNFNSKKDTEDFDYQFKYYAPKGETLPLHKNKKYLFALLRVSVIFGLIAFAVCGAISAILFYLLNNLKGAIELIYIGLKIWGWVVVPMWIIAIISWVLGRNISFDSQEQIKEIVLN